ncbi:hypothetical protein ASPWEDRAFT_203049 [Aspergillus wentii DTO 134E9]|uniref:Uncharacterized protein n=1 Tax=Aspergillus wentii DTO 134E9 TaxID=1073089 RepID=A0A1L9RZK0_ASPWE|nr:uncharacterized protein ASPWEDRAFT_203049 [Aspergillus wentii DTO 134E9]OJJ40323.1 hypothetical protein ASPWEDRAFT_203049 [Aspergillus wentii DTO 134E9]
MDDHHLYYLQQPEQETHTVCTYEALQMPATASVNADDAQMWLSVSVAAIDTVFWRGQFAFFFLLFVVVFTAIATAGFWIPRLSFLSLAFCHCLGTKAQHLSCCTLW